MRANLLRTPLLLDLYLYQLYLQFGQTVGFLPPNSASRPIGKKQIETTIAHVGKDPSGARVLHFGQVT